MVRIVAAALTALALWAPAAQAADPPGVPTAPPTCPGVITRQVGPLSAPWTLLADYADEYLVLTARVIRKGQFGCGYAPAMPGSVQAGQPTAQSPGEASVLILAQGGALTCQIDNDSPWTPAPNNVCLLANAPCKVTCVK
ncbi:hypothetical protein [Phenylobacterium sp.]|uniref:hypothetical protein n=1 Tax=Phenylobacterium sp. TaxID=1871053 RepID=UPI002BAE01A4|nr:hypothetical protein [Phenylobacterium sp.]HVI30858.1 hypothetical protein [Phenylobacterium sp.]